MDSETVTREFDDEQYKLEEGDEEGDVEMQTMERANELSRQYESIKDRTLGENLVAGRLEDIDTSPANSNINVLVDLPGEGNDKTFRFKKPKVWSREYDFVRWIQYYGYDADSFPNMLKRQCDVEVKNLGDEDYKLFIPDYNNRREKVKDSLLEKNEYIEALIHAYRHEDNQIYFSIPLLFFHTIHTIVWMSPLLDYGFQWGTTAALVAIGYLLFISLGAIEMYAIKTKGSSSF